MTGAGFAKALSLRRCGIPCQQRFQCRRGRGELCSRLMVSAERNLPPLPSSPFKCSWRNLPQSLMDMAIPPAGSKNLSLKYLCDLRGLSGTRFLLCRLGKNRSLDEDRRPNNRNRETIRPKRWRHGSRLASAPDHMAGEPIAGMWLKHGRMPLPAGHFPVLAIEGQLGRNGSRTSREDRQLQLRNAPIRVRSRDGIRYS